MDCLENSRPYPAPANSLEQWEYYLRGIKEGDLMAGLVTPATEVHHQVKIKHNAALRLEPTNCKALCDACHNKRTAKGE
jgi:hypothetical protein